jgi:clan AA aspartic protease (TIGR02281 family)
MRKFTERLLIFIAGWGLAWFMYNYSGSKQPAHRVIPAPSISIHPDQSAAGFTLISPGHEDDIVGLLQRNEFETVVERYEVLQDEVGDESVEATRAHILSFAQQLIAQRQIGLAEQLLQRFLIASYRDVEARILLAKVYLVEENFHAAIDQFYEAKGYAYRPAMLQRISSQIQSMVAELAPALKRNNDKNALLALYQQLTQLEPEYAPWFMGLADAQLALENKEAARRSLLLVAQDPDVGAQAQAMLSELSISLVNPHETEPQDYAAEVEGIPLHRSGSHFIVDASTDRSRNVRLLIDTGASLTILIPDVLEQHGIRYQDTGRTRVFNTANGPVRAPIYKLDSLKVGDWQVNQVEIGVLDLSGSSHIDGLLGMNFLRHFQFFIDQNQDLLLLSVK